jgi:hypothetical protein
VIIGFTIIKNAIAQQYPIELVMLQHQDLFDMHIIGVAKENDDETVQLIHDTATKCRNVINIINLDWPGDGAWTEESLDKTLQSHIVDYIDHTHGPDDWVIKIDADEFYHEKDFDEIKRMIEICAATGTTNISTNYLQFCGSLEYTIWDPTSQVFHIYRNKSGVQWAGNDAMILKTEEPPLYLEEVYLHHIGYVKDPSLINVRLQEHLVLNETPMSSLGIKPGDMDSFEFTWPKHVEGARLWPMGIAVANGVDNEVEYQFFGEDNLPLELFKKANKMTWFKPEM